jgi:phosphoribosylformimino-5-aminoimidazole carboxamide ribotide isomerase
VYELEQGGNRDEIYTFTAHSVNSFDYQEKAHLFSHFPGTLETKPCYSSGSGHTLPEIYSWIKIFGASDVMRIIPVLDLLEGLVVHAIKGERERYQPVRSILTSSSDPLEVARCLQTETKCRTFYIADLDAIQGKGHNLEAIGEIASQLDVELWVDAGVADAGSANRLVAAGADVVIIGSETLSDLQQFRFICDSVPREKFIFSLDVAKGRVLSRAEALKGISPSQALTRLTSEGLDRFILLTLDAVGTCGGPDLPLLQDAKRDYPHHSFIAGGGVKTPDHLQALSDAGVDGVLVATSLHKGWIGGRDLMALK